MKEIHEYLSTDKRSVAAGGTLERISVKTFPEYHFDVITKLASNLRHGKVCVEEIEPGLHYILLDCACDRNNMEQVLKRSFCRAARYFMSVNDMKSVHLAYYPFPLSIRDPETLFRFYNGEFVIFISVNIDHVNDVLSPFGLKIEVTRNDEMPWQVLPVGKETSIEDGESFIGFRPLGQLGAEFIRLDWLIENVVVGPYEAIQRRRSELIQTKRQGFEEDGD